MPKKSAKKHVLPDPLPNGEIIQDITKKKWILGPSIGVGGFGEIYSAAEYTGVKKPSNYQYVVKIEPHDNGPLFCEMHFFMRAAKPEMIKTWCTENKIASLGMPRLLGTGSHDHKNKKYRFLIMDKYGQDLWHIFLDNKKEFPVSTVYRISLQLLDVLEYIHSNDYVHADIKGANILLGLTKQTQNQVFLVDFGLAAKWSKKDFKPDPRRAHNGTIEYTSCDAHEGVPTRRGDIEILAYNMIQWMGTVLPWEKKLTDPVVVHNMKKKYLANVNELLKICFGKRKPPVALKEFLDYVTTMNYDTTPDYKKIRNILSKGLKLDRGSLTGPLEFKTSKHKFEDISESETPEKRQKLTPKQKKSVTPKRRGRKPNEEVEFEDSESNEENVPVKKTRTYPKKRENLSNSETEEENVPVKKTKTRSKKRENLSDNETEEISDEENVSIKKTKARSKRIENLSDSETEEENVPVKKTKTRSKKRENFSDNETEEISDEENVPVKRTKTRSKKRENFSDNETEEISDEENVPVKKTKTRSKKREKFNETEEVVTPRGRKKENSVPINGYNAEMLRLQKKIAERKEGKGKKSIKKSSSARSNDLNINLEQFSDSDVVDATPPEKLVVRRKKIVNDDSASPRTLRQKR